MLEKSGAALQARASHAAATDANRAHLRHIIGIECWGQRRLGTILGQPPTSDESDSYQPDAALDWPTVREELARTRQETLTRGRQIATRRIGDTVTARHNDIGALNAREWLRCLAVHARVESLRLR